MLDVGGFLIILSRNASIMDQLRYVVHGGLGCGKGDGNSQRKGLRPNDINNKLWNCYDVHKYQPWSSIPLQGL